MTPNLSITQPTSPVTSTTAAMVQTVTPSPYDSNGGLSVDMLCKKVKRDIRRYGVEEALKRWKCICEYFQTEDWWPPIVRVIEEVFDEAFDEEHKNQATPEQSNPGINIAIGSNMTGANGQWISSQVNKAEQVVGVNEGDVVHVKQAGRMS